jgi:hypothetical protein
MHRGFRVNTSLFITAVEQGGPSHLHWFTFGLAASCYSDVVLKPRVRALAGLRESDRHSPCVLQTLTSSTHFAVVAGSLLRLCKLWFLAVPRPAILGGSYTKETSCMKLVSCTKFFEMISYWSIQKQFEFLTAVKMRPVFFWIVTQCRLVGR